MPVDFDPPLELEGGRWASAAAGRVAGIFATFVTNRAGRPGTWPIDTGLSARRMRAVPDPDRTADYPGAYLILSTQYAKYANAYHENVIVREWNRYTTERRAGLWR